MLRNRNIVITSIQSWDIKIGSNIKNIATELSRENRVLFVNPALDRISKIKGNDHNNNSTEYMLKHGLKIANPNSNLLVLQPLCVMEPINKIPFQNIHYHLNKTNSFRLGYEIKEATDFFGFNDFIHICDSDMFRSFHLKEILKPSVFVYYSRDNLLAVDFWKKHGNKFEPAIMKKSDLVLTNSTYLKELARQHNENSFFVGQGCDTTAYRPGDNYKFPEDIVDINPPKIGYIGSLNTLRLDISILEHIASEKPDWNIVLVGPEDDEFKSSRLHSLPNVYFTGAKKESELPEYLNAFDVAINPQLLNDVTRGNYPRKIDEYLAMGKPVVATKTEAMEYFLPLVSLASSKEEWVLKIEKELNSCDYSLTQKRINLAATHTWENNVIEMSRRILEHEEKYKATV